MTKRFAIIENGQVVNVALADSPISAAWIDLSAQNPQPGPGWSYSEGVFAAPTVVALPPAPVSTQSTKNAFQSRFPKLANGISTKWDAMCQFLTSDSYAASLGVTGAPMFELRMLITTGTERLNASPFVEMAAGGQASGMTYLLTQINPALPFALTATERTAIMTPPLADSETYRG